MYWASNVSLRFRFAAVFQGGGRCCRVTSRPSKSRQPSLRRHRRLRLAADASAILLAGLKELAWYSGLSPAMVLTSASILQARRCGQLWTHPGDEGQRYASLLWYRDPEHLRARQHDIGGAGVIRRCARGARWREFAGLVRHVLHPRRIGSLFGRWGHGRCSLRGSAYRRSPPAVMKVCRRVGAALTAPPETPPSRRHAGRAARRQPAQCRASSAPARSAASATCLRPATPAMQDPAQTAPPAPK